MKRTLLILSLALLAGFFSRDGWRYLTAELPAAPPVQTAPPQTATAQPPSTTSPAVASATRPEESTPDTAPDLATGPRVITDREIPVAEGETVITQGYYETRRGRFVFHTFTPTVETSPSGETIIRVQTENFSIGLDGEYESNKLNEIPVQPNKKRDAIYLSEGRTDYVAIGAKVDPATAMILMTANVSSEPNNIGAPPAED